MSARRVRSAPSLGKARTLRSGMGLLLALVSSGCGGNAALNLPDWWDNPPREEGIFFGVGTAVSTDLQIARSQAQATARADIASQFEVKFEGLTQNLQEQMGGTDPQVVQAFTAATRQVMSQELSGLQTRESETLRENDRYRVFVLAEANPAATSAAMMARLRAQEAAYARFRSSEVFEELTREIERWERSRRR